MAHQLCASQGEEASAHRSTVRKAKGYLPTCTEQGPLEPHRRECRAGWLQPSVGLQPTGGIASLTAARRAKDRTMEKIVVSLPARPSCFFSLFSLSVPFPCDCPSGWLLSLEEHARPSGLFIHPFFFFFFFLAFFHPVLSSLYVGPWPINASAAADPVVVADCGGATSAFWRHKRQRGGKARGGKARGKQHVCHRRGHQDLADTSTHPSFYRGRLTECQRNMYCFCLCLWRRHVEGTRRPAW